MENSNVIQKKINDYMQLCSEKSTYHRSQANYSSAWHDVLGIINVLLISSQALSMTIQTAYDVDSIGVAITGGVFAFVIALSSRISTSYSFNVLSLSHHIVADNYSELHEQFNKLLYEEDRSDLDMRIMRYISINEKTHLQYVIPCKLLICCCRS
jgi:hypothetical protein